MLYDYKVENSDEQVSIKKTKMLLLLLLNRFSRVRLCATL